MTEITCKCGCERKRMVRTADVKRGWGKFFSKSCKARFQERRTGQHNSYLQSKKSINNCENEVYDCDDDQSWDAHKDSF